MWFIYSYMWGGVFMMKMVMKEYSLSKKPGWSEYKARTWFLLPNLFNNSILSYAVYGIIFTTSFCCYQNGGLEATTKLLFK